MCAPDPKPGEKNLYLCPTFTLRLEIARTSPESMAISPSSEGCSK